MASNNYEDKKIGTNYCFFLAFQHNKLVLFWDINQAQAFPGTF